MDKVSASTTPRPACRERALRALDQLPPFSPVLSQLLASLANEDVSFASLAASIERDTVLAGTVLRVVNSVLYGRRGTVSSVRHAVSILGVNKLRNYLLGLSVARLWSKMRTPPAWSMARFNLHSAATGLYADLIVQRGKTEYAEGAFASGILHDIGRLMLAVGSPKGWAEVEKETEETGKPLVACERERLGVDHCELALAALSRWNLPVPMQRAVAFHDEPLLDPGFRVEPPYSLSVVLAVANEAASHLGYSVTPVESERARSHDRCLAELGLEDFAEPIFTQFQTEFEGIRTAL